MIADHLRQVQFLLRAWGVVSNLPSTSEKDTDLGIQNYRDVSAGQHRYVEVFPKGFSINNLPTYHKRVEYYDANL